MNTHTRTSLALLALCLAAGPSLADAPPPDLTHLPNYITALNHSQDPQPSPYAGRSLMDPLRWYAHVPKRRPPGSR
jgi:hypothetical protein